MALFLTRVLPAAVSRTIAWVLVCCYWLAARHRRATVIANLLPALDGDTARARTAAKRLFHNFGVKLLDLWRYEAGLSIDPLLGDSRGWEHFDHARKQNRGVLLLTPHLGNWEFGGHWLAKQGVKLHVITLAEPGADFTELRQQSRARWDIETLVIRDDPLAFVDVIRRLEEGTVVALLVDRPPAPTAVTVTLFGTDFPASVAPAELARATGCVLLPVCVPRIGARYEPQVLPPIPYDRAALRDREARRQLTQTVMRAFEPLIGRHLDQWYHFVPVWPLRPTR